MIRDYEMKKMAENWHAGFKKGYEAAASNPKAWYVLDRNGEKVHIGDKVIDYYHGHCDTVRGFGEWQGKRQILVSDGSIALCFDEFEKAISDTPEKIKDELSDIILYAMKSGKQFDGIDADVSANLNADDFISRILEVWKKEE